MKIVDGGGPLTDVDGGCVGARLGAEHSTVADNQTRQIWKAPKTEFCSARKGWEIISDCRFVTFEQRGVERYEPISLIRDFLKKMPKNLADPQNLRINS